MAMRRQSSDFPDETLEVYARDLMRFNLDDIQDACAAIGGRLREVLARRLYPKSEF